MAGAGAIGGIGASMAATGGQQTQAAGKSGPKGSSNFESMLAQMLQPNKQQHHHHAASAQATGSVASAVSALNIKA